MQVVVSNVPPTYVEKTKNKLLRSASFSLPFPPFWLFFMKVIKHVRSADLKSQEQLKTESFLS